MNYRMIARILGMVLLILAALLVLPLIAGLCYGENVLNFAVTIAAAAALGGIFMLFKPKNRDIYAREGFTAVGLSWILMSLIGALPFVISGDIPSYVDALFETVSGFTTTGATILPQVEVLSRGCMFWRMFTQWIGGGRAAPRIFRGVEHGQHARLYAVAAVHAVGAADADVRRRLRRQHGRRPEGVALYHAGQIRRVRRAPDDTSAARHAHPA